MKVFISHASEDKDRFVRPLADELISKGLVVWYDGYSLNLGDSLMDEINRGLAECDFGVVVLSPAFFRKQWPKNELAALLGRESSGSARKIILPVWLDVDEQEIRMHLPLLADRRAAKASDGLDAVVLEITRAMRVSSFSSSDQGPRVSLVRGDARRMLGDVVIGDPFMDWDVLSEEGVAQLAEFVDCWDELAHLVLLGRIANNGVTPLARELVFLVEDDAMRAVYFGVVNLKYDQLGNIAGTGVDSGRVYGRALRHFFKSMGLDKNGLIAARVLFVFDTGEFLVSVP